jgi:Domain of unknown function (DUF4129)
MIKKLVLFCGTFFLFALCSFAQQQDTTYLVDTVVAPPVESYDEEISAEDTEIINDSLPQATPRYVDEKMVATAASDKDFGYMRFIDSALRNRKVAPLENREREIPADNISFDWVKPMLWILAIGGLLFLIWRLVAGRGVLFTATDKKTTEETPEEEDPLLVAGAAALATEAIRKKEYRLATRYLFVDALMRMGENGRLQILSRKTNQEYLREIQQTDLQQDLARLMLQFEYVWYGGFTPNEAQFQTIHSTFKKFEKTWL